MLTFDSEFLENKTLLDVVDYEGFEWNDVYHDDFEIEDFLREQFDDNPDFFPTKILRTCWTHNLGTCVDIGLCLFDNDEEEYTLWIPMDMCVFEQEMKVGDMVVVKNFPRFGNPPKAIHMYNVVFASEMFEMCGHVATITHVLPHWYKLHFPDFPEQDFLWTEEMLDPYTPYNISYDECACMI